MAQWDYGIYNVENVSLGMLQNPRHSLIIDVYIIVIYQTPR